MNSDAVKSSAVSIKGSPMQALALKGAARRWSAKLHRWSGLALLAFLLIAGITGAIMAFRWEIDRAINPQLFAVKPQSQRLPLQTLTDSVERRFPDAIATTVVLPKTSGDAAIVYVKSRMEAHVAHVHVVGMKGSLDFNQIFVNPYSGEVLGQRSTTRFVASWENFVPDIVRLHYALFLDEVGAWVMGLCAVLWFLTTFVGLGLSWPTAWRSWRRWRALLPVRTDRGGYKLNYDLHRSANLITLPVLVVVAFTSVYLNLPGLVKPVVKAISPATGTVEVPALGPVELSAPKVPAELVLASAQRAFPNARLHSLGMDYRKGLYSVRLQLPGDVSPTGNTTTYFGMGDGHAVFTRKLADGTGGDVFQAWMWPLHTGGAFGLVGQCLVLLGALALVMTCATGLNVWLRKRRGARSALRRRPVDGAATPSSVVESRGTLV